jgi:hypothetical protein
MFNAGAEITLERDRMSSRAIVRGWREDAYLLLEVPDLRWKQKSADPIVCRMSHSGKYYGFTTNFIASLQEINLGVFEYPADIIDNTLRSAERYQVTIPVKLTAKFKNNTFEYEGLITDISKGGCLLKSSRALKSNETFTLSGTFPTKESFDNIVMTALSSEGHDAHFVVRCRFDVVPPEAEQAIARFLKLVETSLGKTEEG